MSRVGKIFCARFRYIDAATGTIRMKSRPVLIVHEPDRAHDTEYTVLPVSSLSSGRTYNIRYDVCLEATQGLTLARTSYIRTHKQMAVYGADIDFNRCIGDLKRFQPSVYRTAITSMHQFEEQIYQSEIR